MIIPMRAPLTLRRNDNPFRVTFVVENEDGSVKDMSGLTARAQFRLYPGAPGAPLIEALSSEAVGTHLNMTVAGIEMVIVNPVIEALPGGSPKGKPAVIHYDILVTELGDENVWFYGPADVDWGVTHVE